MSRPDPRIIELCDRLTSPGPIHGKLSASELHEICDFIYKLRDDADSDEMCEIEEGIEPTNAVFGKTKV